MSEQSNVSNKKPVGDIEILIWKEADKDRKNKVLNRSQRSLDAMRGEVTRWIKSIQDRGDEGILEYIKTFDSQNITQKDLRISEEDITTAFQRIDRTLLQKIKEQISLSQKFHAAVMESIPRSFEIEQIPGVRAGYRKIPVDAAGLYVPAGKAPLPTVAQILTVAAKTAGVPRVLVCFPPTSKEATDAIVVAATLAGADEIYRVGGIAAIAAMAYGTESIAPVQKIVGPGNPWVQAAKLAVVDRVGIDMFSGPSEAVILADDGAHPTFLAADILARCEHGPDSAGVLITNSLTIAQETKREISKQKAELKRKEYIDVALSEFSAIVVVDSLDEMIELTNLYMPEHLEIQTKDPSSVFARIRHAGSTFLGAYAPVAVGDYASGTNHCLPTGCATAYSSPVNPESFMKILQYQELTASGLETLKPIVEVISDAEGLDAHKRSVQIRFEEAL